MQTKTQPRTHSHPLYENEGMSPKKTALIVVTVVGCIAILWPKVFHPMMFGSPPPKPMKEPPQRGGGPGGCCDVVLDREKFFNTTISEIGPQPYRKTINWYTGEIESLRQERPAHLHPESIYQAMRERGRAIPATTTVPIANRKGSASNPPPRYVDGRPGPIPGMRPPMGAGALHQPQAKGSGMGILMPIYTIGIIIFFAYTIMKIVFKKPLPNAPYGPAPTDPNFRKEVFGLEGRHVEDLNGSTLVVTAIQGLIDAADEQLKLRENKATTELSKKPNENSTSNNVETISNGHTNKEHKSDEEDSKTANIAGKSDDKFDKTEIRDQQQRKKLEHTFETQPRKRRDGSADRSVAVLGMEVTASCEGGQKWSGRPPTPDLFFHNEHSRETNGDYNMPTPQSIYLEGALAHESKILVSDAETKREEVYDYELNGSPEEPAVVLSSKMTLSLINLDTSLDKSDSDEDIGGKRNIKDIESPLADDIEIIGHINENEDATK